MITVEFKDAPGLEWTFSNMEDMIEQIRDKKSISQNDLYLLKALINDLDYAWAQS